MWPAKASCILMTVELIVIISGLAAWLDFSHTVASLGVRPLFANQNAHAVALWQFS